MAAIVSRRLESMRRARGLSQRALADASGITRQAVGSIESGRMKPGVDIALRIARALGTTVEDLFAPADAPAKPVRTASATLAGRVVTYALDDDRLAIEPSDGTLPNVFIAGCDLAVGLLTRHASTRTRHLRCLWLTMTNTAALEALSSEAVHAAVVHGELTVRQALMLDGFARFELATTEEGWLVSRGNPLDVRVAGDLVRTKARLANRPAGAGARRLLDEQLRGAKMDPQRVSGYDRVLPGQLDAGRAIAQGYADVAVGMSSVARVFGLSFVPLREERSELVIPIAALHTAEGRALLDALRCRDYRRDLEALGAYDVRRTGERVA
jgi:putative molybdopterin biosynthesis protein